jgi:hypothetical protein
LRDPTARHALRHAPDEAAIRAILAGEPHP